MLKINNYNIQSFTMFEVEGRLDSTHSDELDVLVGKSMENGCKSYLFDFSKLNYISSYGIRIFVKLLRNNCRIAIILQSESVSSIFEMAGLQEKIEIKSCFQEAVSIFTQSNN